MLADIIEEHLDEAVDLFERRQLAFRMLDMTVEDLAEIDERLRANLEGLLLGGEASWDLCVAFLEEGQPGEAFVATILAIEGGEASRLEALETAMATAKPETSQGILGACCLAVWPEITDFLRRQLARSEAEARALALEALVFRRVDPGSAIENAIGGSERTLLIAALRGAGVFRRRGFLKAVEAHACSDDPEISAVALENLVLLDPQAAHRRCLEVLEAFGPSAPAAAGLLGVVGTEEDSDVITRAARSKDRAVARQATLALGIRGTPSEVPVLASLLDEPRSSGSASAVLQWMFGLDLSESWGEAAVEEEEPQTGVPSEWTPDDDLPRFSGSAVRSWWTDNASRFTPGTRLRNGTKDEPWQRLGELPLALLPLADLQAAISSTAPSSSPLYPPSFHRDGER